MRCLIMRLLQCQLFYLQTKRCIIIYLHLTGFIKSWRLRIFCYMKLACWGFANNFKTFHLGGLHSREDSLYKFKRAFNKNSVNIYAIGKKCFNQDIYNWLVSIRSKEKDFDDKTSFFPLYRA